MGKCKIAHLVDHDQAEKFRIKNSISCQSSRLMKPHYRVAPLDASRIRFLFSPSNNFYSLERQSNICFQLQGSVKVTSGWDIFWPLKHYLKQWIPFVFFSSPSLISCYCWRPSYFETVFIAKGESCFLLGLADASADLP